MIKYPIYVISKGRSDLTRHTAAFLQEEGIDFKIAIEPHEQQLYGERFGFDKLIILPFRDLGQGSIPARNFIWEDSINRGHKFHYCLDDNIAKVVKYQNGRRLRCSATPAFLELESLMQQFVNLAICGLNYQTFVRQWPVKPMVINHHVYSFLLIRNELPFRWRGRYNEDTDLCIQALSRNWCTAYINTHLAYKAATMTCKGGNTDELYQDNGRLKMARSLELAWAKYPGLVKTVWKFNRPQHSVKWKMFKTPLKRVENA